MNYSLYSFHTCQKWILLDNTTSGNLYFPLTSYNNFLKQQASYYSISTLCPLLKLNDAVYICSGCSYRCNFNGSHALSFCFIILQKTYPNSIVVFPFPLLLINFSNRGCKCGTHGLLMKKNTYLKGISEESRAGRKIISSMRCIVTSGQQFYTLPINFHHEHYLQRLI